MLAVVFVLLAAPGRRVHLESLGYHAYMPVLLPPDYGEVMTSWDGQWYWDIADNGYPDSARGPDGGPAQTPLAFFPLYPLIVRAVMTVTSADFRVAAPTTSLVIGAAATVVVFRLVERCTDRRRALVAVVLVCTFASAPVLQAAYTESLALLLVACALLLLTKRRYLWCLVPVLLLGLTRNISLALAPVVLVHWVWRWRTTQHTPTARIDPFARVPHVQIGLLLGTTLSATALWPAVAAVITGEPDAYVTTLKAWPGFSGSILQPPLVSLAAANGSLALGAACLAVACIITVKLLPGRRKWGPELTTWSIAYPLYILAVSSATLSALRYLLLAFPLALLWAPDATSPAQRRRQTAVVTLLVAAGLVCQWFWVSKLLVFAGPNGGWGFP
jgi:hypothetical protein